MTDDTTTTGDHELDEQAVDTVVREMLAEDLTRNYEGVVRWPAAVMATASVGHALLEHDLPTLIADARRADAMGPIFDPTLWRRNRAKMLEDMSWLEAALPLWQLARRVRDELVAQLPQELERAAEERDELEHGLVRPGRS